MRENRTSGTVRGALGNRRSYREIHMTKTTILTITRWLVTIVFFYLILHFFNYALFAAWVSGGPPTDYPKTWAYISIKNFYFGFAFLGFEFYRGLTRKRAILLYIRTVPKKMEASLANFTVWLK